MVITKQLRAVAWIAGLALVLSPALPAQQKEKDPRVNPPVTPAGESTSRAPDAAMPTGAAPAQDVSPDSRPLTGAEEFSLGVLNGGRSFLIPTFRITQGFDMRSNQPDLGHQTNINGSLQLQHVASRHTLTASYAAGGTVYSQRGLRTPVHNLSISDSIVGQRWSLLLSNSFSYLPESAFGLGGFGNQIGLSPLPGASLGNFPGISQSGLNPQLLPNQSILTGQSTRISNMALGQFSYVFSPRLSWNAMGGYGILRFLDPGFTNNNNVTFRTGMNYVLGAADTIGITYGYNAVRFQGTTSSTDNHSIQFFYGRKLTGRLAMSAGVGPSFSLFNNPVAGSGTRSSLNITTGLTYAMENVNLTLRYNRFISNGSGVFLGAHTDMVDATAARQISRMWSIGIDGGYAYNVGLSQLNPGSVASRSFHTYRAGASFSRPVGRNANLSFGYHMNYQNRFACPAGTTTSCGSSTLGHSVSISLDWQFRPISLE